MKKLVSLILICLLSGASFALQTTLHKLPPTMDNSSIHKSERAQESQTNEFQSHRRHSSAVKRHGASKSKKQQSKNQDNGKGL
jgi:hypothetical protein